MPSTKTATQRHIIIQNNSTKQIYASTNYYNVINNNNTNNKTNYEIKPTQKYSFNKICFINYENIILYINTTTNNINTPQITRENYEPLAETLKIGSSIQKNGTHFIVKKLFKYNCHVFNGTNHNIWNKNDFKNTTAIKNPKQREIDFIKDKEKKHDNKQNTKDKTIYHEPFESFTDLPFWKPTTSPQTRHFRQNIQEIGLTIKNFPNAYEIFSYILKIQTTTIQNQIINYILENVPRFMKYLEKEIPKLQTFNSNEKKIQEAIQQHYLKKKYPTKLDLYVIGEIYNIFVIIIQQEALVNNQIKYWQTVFDSRNKLRENNYYSVNPIIHILSTNGSIDKNNWKNSKTWSLINDERINQILQTTNKLSNIEEKLYFNDSKNIKKLMEETFYPFINSENDVCIKSIKTKIKKKKIK